MNEPEIDDAIAALRREIALIDDDSGSRERLDALADTLAERRHRDGTQSLSDAVRDMVQTHESRHPQLTLLLNDLATRLASMGI